jgi:hypothetical protein
MISDMIDLEPLLSEYDPQAILAGPLLSLSMSSSYRYFFIAGKGTRVYNSVGLGFVESESDAEEQRADIIEKLKGRFSNVLTFDSHAEMAIVVHSRWQSEETARVLSAAEIAARAEPKKFADHETAEAAPTDPNATSGPAQKLFDPAQQEQDAKRTPLAWRLTSAFPVASRLGSTEHNSTSEPAKINGHDNARGASESRSAHDRIVDVPPQELIDCTGRKQSIDSLPPPKRPQLPNRPNDLFVRQHQDFVLTQDQLASAVLKLKSASQSYGLPVPTAASMQIEPDATATSPLQRHRTSTISRFALGAGIVLVSISLLPIVRQRMGQQMPAFVSDKSSNEIQPPRRVASATTVQPSQVENTQDAVANTSDHQSKGAPIADASSPAQLPEVDSTVAAGAFVSDQHVAAPAASTIAASSPAMQTSEVNNFERASAAVSNPSAPTPQQAGMTDRPNTEEVAKLVNRGMQSLESGDVESAHLALRQAAQALLGPPVPPSTSSGRANDATEAATPKARIAAPDLRAAINEPRGQISNQPTTTLLSKASGPSQPETLDVTSAPVTEQGRPAQEDSMTWRPDSDEIAVLLRRGVDFLNNGDLVSARFSLRRAAEAGNAEAALALGSTYDALVLNQLGAIGIAADVVRARQWYQKAADLGSNTAQQRLAKLPQSGH